MKRNLKVNGFIATVLLSFCFFLGLLIFQRVNGISESLSDQGFLKIAQEVNSDSSFISTERGASSSESSKKVKMHIFTPFESRGEYLVFSWKGKKYSYFVAGNNTNLNSTAEQRAIKNFQNFNVKQDSLDGTAIAEFFKKTNITRSSDFPAWLLSETIAAGLISLASISLIAVFIWMMYTQLKKTGAIGSQSRFNVSTKKTGVTFKDVAGILEEKKELLEIVDFLKRPNKYTSVGARIPKGVLLYGPPGTGKTLLAKAVSGEANVSFISANGSSFEEVFVGLGASRIRDLFKAAKKVAPCIIFIDEIDSLGSRRLSGMGGSNSDQTLNQFLSELDGFESREGVILIGATNRMNILDPALLRSGRFDRKIQVTLPDINEREAILNIHARNKNISKDVSLREVAERTPGFSGAELENSLNEAALVAVRQNKKKISSSDIEEGIDRVVGGPAKKSKIINDKTLLIVAIHEAGHSVIGLVLEGAMQVQKVTIIPRGMAGGYTVSTPKEEGAINTKEMLMETITGLLGGRVAEEFVFGKDNVTTGAYDDFSKASQIARSMVEKFGMSKAGVRFLDSEQQRWMQKKHDISEKKKETQDSEIDRILKLGLERAHDLIKKNIDIVYLVAESLLVLETITSKDLKYILKNKKLPEAVIAKKEKNKDKKYFDLSIIKKPVASN